MPIDLQLDHAEQLAVDDAGDDVRESGLRRPAFGAIRNKVLRRFNRAMGQPNEIAGNIGVLRIRVEDDLIIFRPRRA